MQNAPRAQTATGSTGGRALRLNASAGLTLPSWGAPRRSISSSAPRADLVLQRTAQRMEILMAEIRALGHIPRDHRGLAQRVRRALRQSLLSDSQLAELAELQARCELRTAQRMETMMVEIRAIGHVPRQRQRHREEFALANRLRYGWRP